MRKGQETLLPPGSAAAIAAGCSCAVWDNHHGRGCGVDAAGQPLYWINAACPLHGAAQAETPDINKEQR